MSSITPETTPLLLITNAGLAAASVAKPEGPYIHIVGFQIGSGYGYTPTPNQTAIQGNLLYSSTPSSYQSIGNNTLDILCEIPPQAGPFQFGEVALFIGDANDEYSASSPLFAIAVFATPQTKFSSLGTNVISSYNLNCLLKLEQSTAVFQINTTCGPPDVYNVYAWSDVYPPQISANPSIPTYLVQELSVWSDSTLLQNDQDQWTVGTTYYQYVNAGNDQPGFTVANASTSWIQIASNLMHPSDLTIGNRSMLVRTPDGFFRSVSTIVTAGSNYQLNLNVSNDGTYNNSPLPDAPEIGSTVTLYRADLAPGRLYYSQILDAPAPPSIATPGTPGLAYGGTGTYMPGGGAIEAFGLLQSPSTGAGRQLTSADDLDNPALPSGLYYMFGSNGGRPANIPATYDFIVWNHNLGDNSSSNGSDVTQLAFPMNTGGGDVNGINGLPVYWRQGHNTTGGGVANAWTTWEPFLISNKQGGSLALTVTPDFSNLNLAAGTTITPAAGQSGMVVALFSTDGNPGQTQTLTVNGNVVGTAVKTGSAGYGRHPELTASFSAGQTIQGSNTAGGTVSYYLYYYNT
jgi:hypothetical protein